MISNKKGISIIDWGSAEAQIVPHHEFGEILKSNLKTNSSEFRSLLDGYDLSMQEYKKIEGDIHSLMLLRSIDKLRWAIDKRIGKIPSCVETVKIMYQLKFS